MPHTVGILPPAFATAVHELSSYAWDPRIHIRELEPPSQIAPYAAAIDAEVTWRDEDLGTGRLILLHDPAGNDAWDGDFRCVTFAQAEIGGEMAYDACLADVGWSWLLDALRSADAAHVGESGTITTTVSTPYGTKQFERSSAQIEIRASWTPLLDHGAGLTAHLTAWEELLRLVSGLPPEGETVIPLGPRLAVRR